MNPYKKGETRGAPPRGKRTEAMPVLRPPRGAAAPPQKGAAARSSGRGLAPLVPPGETLATLVATLRARHEGGETCEALLEWLYRLASSLGVHMRYDEHDLEAPAPPPATPPLEEEGPAEPGAGGAMDPPAPPEEEGEEGDGFRRVVPRGARSGKQQRRGTAVPFTIVRGQMTLHIGGEDPSLLPPRDPPAGGDFAAHRGESGMATVRVILSCERRSFRGDYPICAELNGAVLDTRAWRLLAVPPRALSVRVLPRDVDPFLAAGLYDVIQVSDGTVATLYQWAHPTRGPVWCLASQLGYDLFHLRWMGDLTYAEVLYELLCACPGCAEEAGLRLCRGVLGEGDVRLDFSALDPGYCYTVGFRHRNFHPLAADPPGVWNIQAAELATGAARYGPEAPGLPGVPRQATFAPADIDRLLGQGGGAGGGGAPPLPLSLEALHRVNQTALDDAKAAIAQGPPYSALLPPGPGRHVCAFHYGFILRSREPATTGRFSDFLIETPLLCRVRKLMYQRPVGILREELDHSSRLEYHALKAYLTVTDREDFLALFPEFGPRFARYRLFTENVIHLVIHMQRQNATAPCSRSDEGVVPRTRTTTIAKALLTFILSHERTFQAFHRDAQSIVHDFVVRPEYTLLYLKAMEV